ncbi:cupin domain-containing protein [Oceanomicrobium pacificus]|uniref:Cupin domain-containing protein n=1 Tax=Oceanomicrobium pacificus TaxID=2692916 RepID=A0A6B0TQF9_9RHOB|nr:cupin domain-containing protein [Oceanomicrobium pacificus]MXU64919.1 cupin domain-containing protein [Oceanomicrobium pacificus]
MASPVINLDDVPTRDTSHGDRFAATLGRIGPLIGAQKLGCMLHRVSPGKAAFPRHAHHANEEMMIVLEGAGTYRLGDREHPVRAGDIVSAPASDGSGAHQMVNTSDADLVYLCVSTRLDPEVVEYPDSGKFAVASMVPEDTGLLGARIAYIGRVENSLDYFDGEE